ncbi:phage head-tail connector protein [Paenibacillus cymbidii]|uniref:phage head-tail connector protein n=1 Tax=Paenibacillus cymbidii TaxID=1639034 RepID=UPI001080A4BF|nr:DNA-packaging protein [Paenibacillus cymbidii]
MLEALKPILRISLSNTAFDDEINDLIDAARGDLRLSGVLAAKTQDDTDSLIRRAVSLYVKANFGWDNPDASKWGTSYESLKAHLTLSQEYTVEPEDDEP